MNQPTQSSRSGPGLALLLVVLPILVTWTLLLWQLRAIPMQDDYQALIFFAVKFHQLSGLGPHLALIFTAQHDEYKLIFEHMIEGADLAVFSHIHYKFLAILGNLFVVAMLFLYWREFPRFETMSRKVILFAPISLLLMQMNYVETLDWAMCGLQMLPVIFFTLAALHLLCKATTSAFYLACGAALLCCLASANGFALAPVGVLMLLELRAYRRVLGWTVPFAIVGAIYSYHYAHTFRVALIASPTVVQKLTFFLSFLGGAIENQHHSPVHGLCILLGCIVLLSAAFATYKRSYQRNRFAFYVGVWIITTAAGVAQLRTKMGVDTALGNRYKIYSDLAMIFVYGVLVEYVYNHLNRDRAKRLFCAGAIAISALLYVASAYLGLKFLTQRRVHMEVGFREYLKDPAHFSPEVSNTDNPMTGGEPEFSRQVMNEAIAAGVYKVPAYLEPDAGK